MYYKTNDSHIYVKSDSLGDGLEEGDFKAYVSTWTRTPDCYGDVVAKGAFSQTLRKWDMSGSCIPVLYGHNETDPDYNIGYVKSDIEDDHGLLVTGHLDIDTNAKAAQVYRLLKGHRLSQMSFGYTIERKAQAQSAKGMANELQAVNLLEVSIVPHGANKDTSIEAVKSANLTNEYIKAVDAAIEAAGNGDDTMKQDELKQVKADMSTIMHRAEGRAFTPEEIDQLNTLKTKAESIQSDIKRGEEAREALKALLTVDSQPEWQSAKNGKGYLDLAKLTKSIPETMRKDINERHVKGIDMAAITGAMFTPTPIVNSIPIHDQGGEMPIGIVNYIPAGVVHTDEYDYLMETTQEDAGTAAVVEKGETKPTFKLGLKKVRNQLKVIAVVSDPVDKYTWQSSQGVVDYVGERLTREIMRTFENEIINGDGTAGHLLGLNHVEGIKSQAYTSDAVTTAINAAAQIEQYGITCAMFVLPAVDWVEIATTKDTLGHYINDPIVDVQNKQLWGVPVVADAYLESGTGYAIGTNTVQIMTDGNLETATNTSEGFRTNTVISRVEGRFSFDVLKPHGIVKFATKAAAKPTPTK